MKSSLTLAAVLVAASSPAAQSVLRVEPSGASGAFLDIRTAIAAAADGDLVLVETGVYDGGFVVEGKGLVVAADAGADVTVGGAVVVRDVPAGSEVVLQGFAARFLLPPTFFFAGVSLVDNDGHVLLQDLDVESYLVDGVFASSCAAVTVVDSTLAPVLDEAAIGAIDSGLFVHGSTLIGGEGASSNVLIDAMDGGPGLSLVGGTALVTNSQITGGAGGWGLGPFQGGAGKGGPGLLLEVGLEPPALFLSDTSYAGGVGGQAFEPPTIGQDGADADVVAGSVSELASAARRFHSDPVVRDGEATTLSFEGEPFDLVWLLLGLDTSPVAYLPAFAGAIHPGGSPLVIRFVGLLDASGAKDLNLTLSPTGLDYLPFYEQAVMYDLAADAFVASNPRFVAFLASTLP